MPLKQCPHPQRWCAISLCCECKAVWSKGLTSEFLGMTCCGIPFGSLRLHFLGSHSGFKPSFCAREHAANWCRQGLASDTFVCRLLAGVRVRLQAMHCLCLPGLPRKMTSHFCCLRCELLWTQHRFEMGSLSSWMVTTVSRRL